MPGYLLHFAACADASRTNRSFIVGVEMPDILKKYYKSGGLEGANLAYKALRTKEMPDFKVFEERVQEQERDGKPCGMHYGVSSRPDIIYFWNSLSESEKKNPFWRGYLWHLITDLLMYSKLNIDAKFDEFMKKNIDSENFKELRKAEVAKLHDDWDKTNAKVRDIYPSVSITAEVEEFGVVKYIDNNTLYYVDWPILKNTIDYLRRFNPLEDDLDEIIEQVMKMV